MLRAVGNNSPGPATQVLRPAAYDAQRLREKASAAALDCAARLRSLGVSVKTSMRVRAWGLPPLWRPAVEARVKAVDRRWSS